MEGSLVIREALAVAVLVGVSAGRAAPASPRGGQADSARTAAAPTTTAQTTAAQTTAAQTTAAQTTAAQTTAAQTTAAQTTATQTTATQTTATQTTATQTTAAQTTAAQKPGADQTPPDDNSLQRYRTPFEVLTERTIGAASRAVRFDWRRSSFQLALTGSQLLELNNFTSGRLGLLLRKPFGDLMAELGVAWVFTGGSPSSDTLALTPYRQVGRPSRLEIDLNAAYPLAEGVATARVGFFPATELVFSIDAGLRYRYYPGELSGQSFGDVAKAVLAPRLSSDELDNLEGRRLPGMRIDPSRYDLLLGFSLDLYFGSGGFLSPRVMVAPSFTGASETKLGWWWELTLGAGWAF
jgi:hypothetical protein